MKKSAKKNKDKRYLKRWRKAKGWEQGDVQGQHSEKQKEQPAQ